MPVDKDNFLRSEAELALDEVIIQRSDVAISD